MAERRTGSGKVQSSRSANIPFHNSCVSEITIRTYRRLLPNHPHREQRRFISTRKMPKKI
jgi:hypothetical protein